MSDDREKRIGAAVQREAQMMNTEVELLDAAELEPGVLVIVYDSKGEEVPNLGVPVTTRVATYVGDKAAWSGIITTHWKMA